MKRTDPKRVDLIIREAIEASGHADTYLEYRACYMWAEVVGEYINAHTTRRYVDKDTLHVYISSASLRSELTYAAPSLIKAINDRLGTPLIRSISIH